MSKPPFVQYLNFLGDVNDNSVRATINVCSTLITESPNKSTPRPMERPDTIYFFLSSRGGTIDSAITLYNFLQSLPVEIVMHNNGSVDSSANIIFLAGARRYAFPQSSFLFHGSTWHFPSGNVDGIDVTRSQLSEALSQLTNGEELMRKIIVERTKLTLEVVNGLFLEGAKRNSEFALSNGVVHEIKDLRLPATTSIYTIPDR